MTRVAILGSTGSIGTQALEVIAANRDRLAVDCLVSGTAGPELAAQGRTWGVPALAAREAGSQAAILEAVTRESVDVVLIAGGGAAALLPTLAAIRAGKHIALATKEILVMAGAQVMSEAKQAGVEVRPVDSEHSALWQCLWGEDPESVSRLVLTASGGPFLERDLSTMHRVTREEALAHPRWSMGPKITVDSATMMNKGLEIIEAHHLFGIPYSGIEVVVHPESVVHSLVEFRDGSVKAQLGRPDMRVPIALALAHPGRMPARVEPPDLARMGALTFRPLDPVRFPAVELARFAGRAGGLRPAALNAANESAVEGFLKGEISFDRIVPMVAEAVSACSDQDEPVSLQDLLGADHWAREFTGARMSAAGGVA